MLVLSRRKNERIQIGSDITIVVTKIGRDRVSIAIGAPSDVPIVRGEITESKTIKESEGKNE